MRDARGMSTGIRGTQRASKAMMRDVEKGVRNVKR